MSGIRAFQAPLRTGSRVLGYPRQCSVKLELAGRSFVLCSQGVGPAELYRVTPEGREVRVGYVREVLGSVVAAVRREKDVGAV